MKLIPTVGVVAAAAAAGATTYAVGKAFCYYDASAAAGNVPEPERLRQYYEEQLKAAKSVWGNRKPESAGAAV